MDKLNFFCSVKRLSTAAIFRLKFFLILFFCNCNLITAAETIDTSINIIPRPASLIHLPGIFHLTAQTSLYVHNTEEEQDAEAFNAFLKNERGISLPVTRTKPLSGNYIELHGGADYLQHKDEYRIFIDTNRTVIWGRDGGVFYGFISLIQLIHQDKDSFLYMPGVSISDYPRFQWRGMHLDVCRHFFPNESILLIK